MNTTDKLGLRMPGSTDSGAIADLNFNALKLDTEVSSRIKTLNGMSADEDTGNLNMNEIPYARQLITDDKQPVAGEILCRATGGGTSITDGDAELISVLGRMVHEGYQEEGISLTVNAVEREDPITATYDRDTFVEYASTSGTYTFTRTSGAWDPTLANTGITVTGTPVNGDEIRVIYVKGERGTITQSRPTGFRYTGWNLYNNATGKARVVKYSETYGFKIGGTYDYISFSENSDGSDPVNLYPDGNGLFMIPGDGYVIVEGGNDTDTYILMTWSDWTDGYPGGWEAYTDSTISFANAMTYFPNGLMQVGNVADEINFRDKKVYRRIIRQAYTASNFDDLLAQIQSYGVDYTYDSTAFYYVNPTPPTGDTINIPNTFNASDHGMEIIDGNGIPVYANMEYNQNLVSKLRTDVVTISSQELTDTQKNQVQTNIGAASKEDVAVLNDTFLIRSYTFTTTAKVSASGAASYTTTQFNVVPIEGYSILCIFGFESSVSALMPYAMYARSGAGEQVLKVRNVSSSDQAAGKTLVIKLLWVKNQLLGA